MFGARRDREPKPRGLRPLHAAAAVLAAGVLVAAYVVTRDTSPAPDIVSLEAAPPSVDPVAEAAPPPAADQAATTAPSPDPEMAPEPAPETAIAALEPEAAPSPDLPGSAPAGTGIADARESTLSTPVPLPDPVVVGSAADPASPAPPVERQADATVAFTPPPPPGTVFDMDERGLVRPTEDGALTPEGVLVYSGLPTPLPPAAATGRTSPDPAAAPAETGLAFAEPAESVDGADAAVAEALAAPATETAPEATDTLAAAPATGAIEPGALAVTAPAATPEAPEPDALDTTEAEADAAFAAAEPALPDIPATRPQLRPESAPEAAPAAPPVAVASAAEDTPRPRNRPGGTAPDAEAEAIAVAVAAQPPAAPDFEALAEQARTQTAAAGAGIVAAAPRAAAPPPAEPEGRSNVEVQPSAPTRGSVADRATLANAISLSNVNLIGVYGSASDRRALIRLPSGRYVKVKVGDRVDGGQVAAIQSSSVDYVKDGRRYALTLPNG